MAISPEFSGFLALSFLVGVFFSIYLLSNQNVLPYYEEYIDMERLVPSDFKQNLDTLHNFLNELEGSKLAYDRMLLMKVTVLRLFCQKRSCIDCLRHNITCRDGCSWDTSCLV